MLADLPFALNVDLARIFAAIEGSSHGQWVQKILRAGGGLGIDLDPVLEYGVLTI